MAMPKGLRIRRIIALVNALAKLHNFCIDENDKNNLLQPLSSDTLNMMNDANGYVPMEASREHGMHLPMVLMNGGDHFHDVPRNVRRQNERQYSDANLPRQRLLQQVVDSHLKRPN